MSLWTDELRDSLRALQNDRDDLTPYDECKAEVASLDGQIRLTKALLKARIKFENLQGSRMMQDDVERNARIEQGLSWCTAPGL